MWMLSQMLASCTPSLALRTCKKTASAQQIAIALMHTSKLSTCPVTAGVYFEESHHTRTIAERLGVYKMTSTQPIYSYHCL